MAAQSSPPTRARRPAQSQTPTLSHASTLSSAALTTRCPPTSLHGTPQRIATSQPAVPLCSPSTRARRPLCRLTPSGRRQTSAQSRDATTMTASPTAAGARRSEGGSRCWEGPLRRAASTASAASTRALTWRSGRRQQGRRRWGRRRWGSCSSMGPRS